MIVFGVGTAISFAQSLTRDRRVKEKVQRALQDAAEDVADEIRRAAPDETGALQASVRVEPARVSPGVVIKAGGAETTRKGRGRSYDYAVAAEFGTRKQPAQPFFYPTVRENRSTLDDAIRGGVEDAMEE